MSVYDERIYKLRNIMKDKGIDVYIVCTEDFHGSEYVGDYFKEREYLSGFTGSAGTLVITYSEAALWTDGRYFLQAEKQLAISNIRLMKMGEASVDTIEEYLAKLFDNKDCGCVIGFDGRTVNTAFIENIIKAIPSEVTIHADENLVDLIWKERPLMSAKPIWELQIGYAGRTREDKLAALRDKMKQAGSDVCILSSLDDIAWLLNLRGNDIACNPVFLSFMIIEMEHAVLYVNCNIISKEIKGKLEAAKVELKAYDEVYSDVQKMNAHKSVIVDHSKINYRLMSLLPDKLQIQNIQNPIVLMKAKKNKIECENMRKAHIKDGIAVTRFMHWLKKNVGKVEITEISAAKKLEEFRSNQKGYIEPSFEPIMAYGSHGAIIHYSATQKSNAKLQRKGFLLSDTGGHYLEGTTDVTRTFVLGQLGSAEKAAYTLVLRGNIDFSSARFLYGVTGMNLDILARQPLWQIGLDYRHGTGHGVGYALNVHEGPNSIGWRKNPQNSTNIVLEEGMITSCEPGLYMNGNFGIRLENLLLCRSLSETEYGRFMGFETLTLVPFDLEGIDKSLLSDKEIEWLNIYHSTVYNMLSPYFDDEELKWLQFATRSI